MIERIIHWVPPQLLVTTGAVFPARHCWCVGRNYAEHAREMGADPGAESPVFFSKPAAALVSDSIVDYPENTESLHHEVELVVVMSAGGRHLDPEECNERIFGYAVGIDLTRRDIQAKAKQAGHPWEMSKGFDQSAPVGLIVPAGEWTPQPDAIIELQVNGVMRQQAALGDMIWPVNELIARLSQDVTLQSGDVVFTGTPAGVASLEPGDRVVARIGDLPPMELTIRPTQFHD